MFRTVLLILFMILIVSAAVSQTADVDVPPAHESDGCTWFPDGNYRECCVAHDNDYFEGGSCKARRESDDRLYRCVKSKKGWQNKILAPIMWVGVRVFGTSLLPTPHRWGFGRKKEKRKMQVFNKPAQESDALKPADPAGSKKKADETLVKESDQHTEKPATTNDDTSETQNSAKTTANQLNEQSF